MSCSLSRGPSLCTLGWPCAHRRRCCRRAHPIWLPCDPPWEGRASQRRFGEWVASTRDVAPALELLPQGCPGRSALTPTALPPFPGPPQAGLGDPSVAAPPLPGLSGSPVGRVCFGMRGDSQSSSVSPAPPPSESHPQKLEAEEPAGRLIWEMGGGGQSRQRSDVGWGLRPRGMRAGRACKHGGGVGRGCGGAAGRIEDPGVRVSRWAPPGAPGKGPLGPHPKAEVRPRRPGASRRAPPFPHLASGF